MTRPLRYELVRELGSGGFGTVWMARAHGGVVREVALKILHGGRAGREDLVRRLRDEARLLAMLRHRATVKVEDLVELPEGWAVVLEYVDGADLRDLVGLGPVPPRALAELAVEVAGSLAEAHDASDPATGRPLGLVHRDIKPENLRVARGGACKVLDFGVARAEFGAREAVATVGAFGSSGYLAPERLEARDLPAGDVFALGIVMAEALLGRRTGQGALTPEGHAAWVEARRGELEAVAPPELAGLVAAMVAYAPEARPTAAEVERRLEGLALPGPGLRRWAEAALAAHAALGPGGTAALPSGPVGAGGARSGRGWAVGLGTVGIVAVLVAAFVLGRTRSPEGAPEMPAPPAAPVAVAAPSTSDPVGTPAAPSAALSEDPDAGGSREAPRTVGSRAHMPSPSALAAPAPVAPTLVAEALPAAVVVSAEAAPAPAPVPDPHAGSGRVRVEGGATVRLLGPGGAVPAGWVPAGPYRFEYHWGDGRWRQPSTPLVVTEGGTIEVRCDAVSELCRW